MSYAIATADPYTLLTVGAFFGVLLCNASSAMRFVLRSLFRSIRGRA